MTSTTTLVFVTRSIRMFAYGMLSIVLVLYLAASGIGPSRTGVVLALAFVGDTAVSLWMTTRADRVGRRRMLQLGALLMVLAGTVFAVTRSFPLLIAAAALGVLSPGGGEVGPFLCVEQAILAQVLPPAARTRYFAWYNLAGALAGAAGALAAGAAAGTLERAGIPAAGAYRAIVASYAALGLMLVGLVSAMPATAECSSASRDVSPAGLLGLRDSSPVVLRLAGLFALDACGGGLVLQSVVAYWFVFRFGIHAAALGAVFFGANVLAGASALVASRVANRFGLLNTMVFTHLPSNVLLMLVPYMPSLPLATAVLLARYSISQMDVPTRQAYTMGMVRPDARSSAAGVTGTARSLGAAISPALAGRLLTVPALAGLPFVLAGGIKIVYDLLLFRGFRALPPGAEAGQ